jgi:hypothetical protein
MPIVFATFPGIKVETNPWINNIYWNFLLNHHLTLSNPIVIIMKAAVRATSIFMYTFLFVNRQSILEYSLCSKLSGIILYVRC